MSEIENTTLPTTLSCIGLKDITKANWETQTWRTTVKNTGETVDVKDHTGYKTTNWTVFVGAEPSNPAQFSAVLYKGNGIKKARQDSLSGFDSLYTAKQAARLLFFDRLPNYSVENSPTRFGVTTFTDPALIIVLGAYGFVYDKETGSVKDVNPAFTAAPRVSAEAAIETRKQIISKLASAAPISCEELPGLGADGQSTPSDTTLDAVYHNAPARPVKSKPVTLVVPAGSFYVMINKSQLHRDRALHTVIRGNVFYARESNASLSVAKAVENGQLNLANLISDYVIGATLSHRKETYTDLFNGLLCNLSVDLRRQFLQKVVVDGDRLGVWLESDVTAAELVSIARGLGLLSILKMEEPRRVDTSKLRLV